MLSVRLPLVCLAVACSPYRHLPDRWTVTALACADGEDACDAALAADFHLDSAGFSDEGYAATLDALQDLHQADVGRVSDLTEDDVVRRPFRDELSQVAKAQGTDDLRQAIYNWSAEMIAGISTETLPQDDWLAARDPATGEVVVRDRGALSCGAELSILLVHEAAHGVAPPHVPCPDRPDDACDRHWTGAYGFEAAYAEQRLRTCADAATCDAASAALDYSLDSVLAD